jgi:hypothetical protein
MVVVVVAVVQHQQSRGDQRCGLRFERRAAACGWVKDRR